MAMHEDIMEAMPLRWRTPTNSLADENLASNVSNRCHGCTVSLAFMKSLLMSGRILSVRENVMINT